MYEYRCSECGNTDTITDDRDGPLKARADAGLITCTCTPDAVYRRRFSFSTPPMMHEHYNYTVGRPISSMRQFRDELKRASEEHTLRTGGVPADFQPIDHEELVRMSLEKHGDDGLKEQHDAAVARGEKPATGRMVF